MSTSTTEPVINDKAKELISRLAEEQENLRFGDAIPESTTDILDSFDDSDSSIRKGNSTLNSSEKQLEYTNSCRCSKKCREMSQI